MSVVRIVVGLLILFALIVLGINAYLSPDDLGKCEANPTDKDGCHKADAVVAVSGGDTEARANEAIWLYKNGWANYIIFSGAAADKSGPSNAEVMRDIAVNKGVSQSAIIIEESSENTTENASETQGIFAKYGIKDAIIVTSAYHQRRAMFEFSKWAADTELRSHPVARDKQWSEWWWLTPHGWFYALSEVVKTSISATGGVNR